MSSDINTTNKDYVVQEIKSWDEFDFSDNKIDLLRGIYSYGFEQPSPIQKKAIKPLMEGRDIITIRNR